MIQTLISCAITLKLLSPFYEVRQEIKAYPQLQKLDWFESKNQLMLGVADDGSVDVKVSRDGVWTIHLQLVEDGVTKPLALVQLRKRWGAYLQADHFYLKTADVLGVSKTEVFTERRNGANFLNRILGSLESMPSRNE